MNPKKSINQLVLIDKARYILDGTLLSIDEMSGINKKATLDEASVRAAIDEYKKEFISKGIAYGVLQQEVIVDKNDELSVEELNQKTKFDIKLLQDFEEESLSEDEIAFQIIDMMFDRDNRRIFGRIQILETPEGMKAREQIDAGLNGYISSSGVDDVVARDKRLDPTQDWKFIHKFQSFRGGWKLSFAGKKYDIQK